MQQLMPTQEKKAAEFFQAERNPFKAPTEVLPSECPPSMPLCRFDRSQLKLVGVIQVSEGEFKGLVEDPDGRGYFITPGMQIGGATVTQVTNRGNNPSPPQDSTGCPDASLQRGTRGLENVECRQDYLKHPN